MTIDITAPDEAPAEVPLEEQLTATAEGLANIEALLDSAGGGILSVKDETRGHLLKLLQAAYAKDGRKTFDVQVGGRVVATLSAKFDKARAEVTDRAKFVAFWVQHRPAQTQTQYTITINRGFGSRGIIDALEKLLGDQPEGTLDWRKTDSVKAAFEAEILDPKGLAPDDDGNAPTTLTWADDNGELLDVPGVKVTPEATVPTTFAVGGWKPGAKAHLRKRIAEHAGALGQLVAGPAAQLPAQQAEVA